MDWHLPGGNEEDEDVYIRQEGIEACPIITTVLWIFFCASVVFLEQRDPKESHFMSKTLDWKGSPASRVLALLV